MSNKSNQSNQLDQFVTLKCSEFTNGRATFHAADICVQESNGELSINMFGDEEGSPVIVIDVTTEGDLRVLLGGSQYSADEEGIIRDIAYVVGRDGRWYRHQP